MQLIAEICQAETWPEAAKSITLFVILGIITITYLATKYGGKNG